MAISLTCPGTASLCGARCQHFCESGFPTPLCAAQHLAAGVFTGETAKELSRGMREASLPMTWCIEHVTEVLPLGLLFYTAFL